ncbi:DUF4174 domain-containing protein [Kushneria aurantia]|uniref:DUF4174 domain-containing protein n=1 Tax=Kushneria aurantia TaxID=504092 RepID=A0ABV6G145_9GAMM|nr:DUF4174 domain-containing protein [Kushneria aurantia]
MTKWYSAVLLTAALVGIGNAGAADIDPAANPLLADQGRSRPLVIVTPDNERPDYQRMRGIVETSRGAFSDRDMVLYTVEAGAGRKEGQPLTDAETRALLAALGTSADGPLTTVLVGKDGGKKVEQQGFVDPRQVYDTIDNMALRRAESR